MDVTISCPWCLWCMGVVGANTKDQLDEAAQEALVEHARHEHPDELEEARSTLLKKILSRGILRA